MHRTLPVLAACVLALCGACASTSLIEEEPVDLTVEHVLRSIAEALGTVHDRHADGDLDLEVTKVEVLLETAVDKSLSGDFTVSIVEIDAERENEITQKVKLTLEPPAHASGAVVPSSGRGDPHLVEELERGLDAAYAAAKGARAGLGRLHAGAVPLETKTLEVAIEFDVTTSEDGLPTISILGLDLGRTKERVHTVTLTFEVLSGGSST